MVLDTVDWMYLQYASIFNAFDLFSVAVFTVEYILLVWSCTANPEFKDPVRGRLRFMTAPLALIDLMVVLPFYLPIVFPDLRFMRALRLFRLFRVLKLARYSSSLQTVSDVLKRKEEELLLMLLPS